MEGDGLMDEADEKAVLTEIMRRILSGDEGYVWWGSTSPSSRPHLTLDLSIEISDEEMQMLAAIYDRSS